MAIADQEAVIPDDVVIPVFMKEIVAAITHAARASPHINQLSGVSVRLTISNLETLGAAATRRSLMSGDTEIVPRVCDLDALIASTAGKIEVDALEEGRDGEVIDHLMRSAVLMTFKNHAPVESIKGVVDAFENKEGDEEAAVVSTGLDVSDTDYVKVLETLPALRKSVTKLVGKKASMGEAASALELILEGLHLSKRLNKDASASRSAYRSRS